MKQIFLILSVVLVIGCQSYDAREALTAGQYDSVLIRVAPYVIRKPDEISYEERFLGKNRPFYKKFLTITGGEITHYLEKDTAVLFSFQHRDMTSLYEHYRALGGYYKLDKGGNIAFMNLLYHTPRLTKDEMESRGEALFNEMVKTGHVSKYIGNKDFIDTPSDDFYYDTKRNRWDYTENSSWKFLEEAKERAANASDSAAVQKPW
jgi:hypothetical protein